MHKIFVIHVFLEAWQTLKSGVIKNINNFDKELLNKENDKSVEMNILIQ